MFAAVSHLPMSWYAPIALCAAVWFLGAAIYALRRGYIYAGRNSQGGYKKISKAESPETFGLWISVMFAFCVVFCGLAIGGFIAHPIR